MKKQKALIALEALVALALAFAIVFTVRVARAQDYNREEDQAYAGWTSTGAPFALIAPSPRWRPEACHRWFG